MANDESNPWREAAEGGFEDRPAEKESSPLGCLMWGCLIAAVVAIVLAITVAVGGYYFLKGQIEEYTETEPMQLPAVEIADEEMAALEARVEAFSARFEAKSDEGEDAPAEAEAEADDPTGDGPLELVLTADELNALIAQNKDLKGRVFIQIEDGLISGQVSIPTDFLPIGCGRFFNATAKFDVELSDGDLDVTLVDATVKGEPLPQQFLDAFADEDLASDFQDDADVKPVLERIESLRIEGDRIILTARPPEVAVGAGADPEKQESSAAESP